jgi:hypothetical protein
MLLHCASIKSKYGSFITFYPNKKHQKGGSHKRGHSKITQVLRFVMGFYFQLQRGA